ncbi:MAG: LLM class flavin-dependent oxidoreductase [Chloroflexota bacterium]|nr:LLM class flavin-dependent oxidoreductase [Chloroflexota bacterium]MDE2961476.1 LLM class flavin-dependent oxidoreductase [Chloroflexota bacterium]
MAKMEIGLYDVLDQAQMESHALAADVYDEHIRGAQEAEQMGYKYYFSIEHQSSDVSFMSSPSVYLTALARATSAMRFGVMIYQLPFHHPIRLAEEVAMLDHLSRGRVEFGAGTGVTYHEFLRWNVDFDRRRAISEEALDIILMAWKEGSVTYEGEFFKFDEVLSTPDTYQKPHPPVWFGCHSAASFEYSAKQNFHVSQNIDTDPVIAEKFETWRKLWRAEGHDTPMPKTFLTRHVHVAETDAKAREQAEPFLATAAFPSAIPEGKGRDIIGETRIGYGPFGMRGEDPGTPERAELRRTFRERAQSYDFWIDNGIALVGSPETVAKRLRDQHDLIGHDIFCARHLFGYIDPDAAKRSIQLFAEEVMPAFA